MCQVGWKCPSDVRVFQVSLQCLSDTLCVSGRLAVSVRHSVCVRSAGSVCQTLCVSQVGWECPSDTLCVSGRLAVSVRRSVRVSGRLGVSVRSQQCAAGTGTRSSVASRGRAVDPTTAPGSARRPLQYGSDATCVRRRCRPLPPSAAAAPLV